MGVFFLLFVWLVFYISDMRLNRAETQRRRLRLREELRALSLQPLMRGSLVERRRRCGRPNCACAKDPRKRHGGRFLTVQVRGRTHAVHVRPEDEPRVAAAIGAYQRLWDLINQLTLCELSDLKREARERRRAVGSRRS
jgi:hypothetical protein